MSRSSSSRRRVPKALLLGMVFSEETEPKRGQEFRDRVRCEAMEDLGYAVYTLDNKHSDVALKNGRHCQSNFADARRMFRSIEERWGMKIQFDSIVLDYFFSPVGWARERWTDNLFRETLPQFVTDDVLKEGGSLWLPNLKCVEELILEHADVLIKYYTWELVQDPLRNPLYLATEAIEDELLKCPDSLTNETQIRPLDDFSSTPFYEFKPRRLGAIEQPSTPRKMKISGGNSSSGETDAESSPESNKRSRRR